ncbi:ferredoxin-fold anticodon binding domain-containing protein [Bacillus fengqiuensis]|nr:ferredoxin-fold anticodon binding domain-containing protein [Bacillus fengqiuensis]
MSCYNEEDERAPKMVSVVDPYVYETLQTVIGKRVVIETVRGNVTGNLNDVKPDHVVIKEKDSTFFVRIQQIVWIMPD